MEAFRLVVWAVLWAVRAWSVGLFAVRFFTHFEFGSLAFALVEGHALFLAVQNERHKVAADRSFLGFVAPAAFLVSGFLQPVGASSVFSQWLLLAVSFFLVAVRAYLGRSYSLGTTTWFGLCDEGPYRWVRHPNYAVHCLKRLVVLQCFPTMFNLQMTVFHFLAMLAVIAVEERFLGQFDEYREYKERVRWRLLPFVF